MISASNLVHETMNSFFIRFVLGLILAASLGCAGVRTDRSEQTGKRACDFTPVYAADPPSTPPGAIREDKHWVKIRVVLSEAGLDFGYLNDQGNFIKLFNGPEGKAECLGGVYYPFAIRIGGPDPQVYSMADLGRCEPAGDSIPAGQAVRPASAESYTSAVKLHFQLPDRSAVTVLLTTTPPNGFLFD
jgi:hypothetical protein